MSQKNLIYLLILFQFLLLSPPKAYSQTAATVPIHHSVYHFIDLLVAHRLVNNKEVILGQRPYSRLEVARLLKEAQPVFSSGSQTTDGKEINESSLAYLRDFYDKYYDEFREDIEESWPEFDFKVMRNMNWSFSAQSGEIRRDNYARGTGGSIDWEVTSFDEYMSGRTHEHGFNAFINTQHDLRGTPYFVLVAKPLFQLSPSNEVYRASFSELYVKTGWRNFEFLFGRDEVIWGQGEFGGLLFSSNARPKDMVKLTTPYPFYFPGFLKHIGASKFTFFVSNLGHERDIPEAFLSGVKFSLKPAKIFEIGLSEAVVMGGEGAPDISAGEAIGEIFPLHKWGRNSSFDDQGNHLFGLLDFRLHLPFLRQTSLYWESIFEDSFLRAMGVPGNIMNQMSFQTGIYVPRLTAKGDVSLRLEYQHTSPINYRHGTWSSGYTLNRRIIGSPIGPDADSLTARITWWPESDIKTSFDLVYQNRSRDTYFAVRDGSEQKEILKNRDFPNEQRLRLVGSVEWDIYRFLSLNSSLGYEYVSNFNFESNNNRHNGLFLVGTTLHFDRLK